jgi:hypothetical protein
MTLLRSCRTRARFAAKAAVADVDTEASAMLLDRMVRASRHYEREVRAYAKAARRSARGRA